MLQRLFQAFHSMLLRCLKSRGCSDLDFANVDTQTIGFAHLYTSLRTHVGTEVLDVQYTTVIAT